MLMIKGIYMFICLYCWDIFVCGCVDVWVEYISKVGILLG